MESSHEYLIRLVVCALHDQLGAIKIVSIKCLIQMGCHDAIDGQDSAVPRLQSWSERPVADPSAPCDQHL